MLAKTTVIQPAGYNRAVRVRETMAPCTGCAGVARIMSGMQRDMNRHAAVATWEMKHTFP